MKVSEAKRKGHCGVQELPNFDLSFLLSLPQGYPAVPSTPKEPEPWADLGVPP